MNLDGPLLWYLNRGTGLVLLVLFTLSVCLGVLARRATADGIVPGFVRQDLHRNVSLVSTIMLVGHVTTAVVDRYVDIRWWQALSPIGATYKPVWLGLGAVALDLILLIVVTSLLRSRMSARLWRSVHWLSYAAWAASMVHAVGIGTDATTSWGRWLGAGCLVAVAAAVALRLAPPFRRAARVRARDHAEAPR